MNILGALPIRSRNAVAQAKLDVLVEGLKASEVKICVFSFASVNTNAFAFVVERKVVVNFRTFRLPRQP